MGIICVMGLPTLDKALQGLIEAMNEFPQISEFVGMADLAKMIGLCIAMGLAANECYQMMLGRRGLDIMKLIHIVIISICITSASAICDLAREPGQFLEETALALLQGSNQMVIDKEAELAKKQKEYLDHVKEVIAKAEQENKTEISLKDWVLHPEESLSSTIDEFVEHQKNNLKKAALAIETKLSEWIALIIRFIGEVIFQMSYFGMLVAQRIFMTILEIFAPLMFALSLSPHFKSAWSQWLSKFLSLSLWGFITYVVIYYVNHIMMYTLQCDIENYNTLMGKTEVVDWEEVGMIGMQGVGTTCMYVMALLCGAFIIRMVPEVASWCIPGGVSSGAGEKSGALATSAASGAIGGAVGASVVVAKKGDSFLQGTENAIYNAGANTASVANAYRQSTPGMLKNPPSSSKIK